MASNQYHLLTTQRFLPLFITQFFNAFNDNVFKNAFVILVAYKITHNLQHEQLLIASAGAIFILPFFLFSATAGQLADKYEKSFLIRIIKFSEIIIMIVGSFGFYLNHTALLMTTLFFLGLHSTLFGPIKYAILPESLHEKELLGGNALIEAGTFIAILIGQILGGSLILGQSGVLTISLALVSVAVAGFIICLYIPRTQKAAPDITISKNIVKETWHLINTVRQEKNIFLAIIGISWFWFIGATLLTQFPTFTKDTLHGMPSVFTLFLTIFSIGIGVGSLLCNVLLKGEINPKYTAIALVVISLCLLDMSIAARYLPQHVSNMLSLGDFFKSIQHIRLLLDVFLMTIACGVYIVPLYALIQKNAPPSMRSRVIGCNNIINSLFMVVSSLFIFGIVALGLTSLDAFVVVATLNLSLIYILRKLAANS